jgi:hypothetical protein
MVRAVRQRDTHPSDPAKSEDEKGSVPAKCGLPAPAAVQTLKERRRRGQGRAQRRHRDHVPHTECLYLVLGQTLPERIVIHVGNHMVSWTKEAPRGQSSATFSMLTMRRVENACSLDLALPGPTHLPQFVS